MNVTSKELIFDHNNVQSEAAYENLLDLLQTDGVVEIDEFRKEFNVMYHQNELVLLKDAVAKIEEEFNMELEFDEQRVYLIDYVIDEDDDDLTGVNYGC